MQLCDNGITMTGKWLSKFLCDNATKLLDDWYDQLSECGQVTRWPTHSFSNWMSASHTGKMENLILKGYPTKAKKRKPASKNCMFDNSETATCSLEDDEYQLPVSGTSGRSPHRWMSIAHRSYSPIILTHLTGPCKPSSIIFAVNRNTLNCWLELLLPLTSHDDLVQSWFKNRNAALMLKNMQIGAAKALFPKFWELHHSYLPVCRKPIRSDYCWQNHSLLLPWPSYFELYCCHLEWSHKKSWKETLNHIF